MQKAKLVQIRSQLFLKNYLLCFSISQSARIGDELKSGDVWLSLCVWCIDTNVSFLGIHSVFEKCAI